MVRKPDMESWKDMRFGMFIHWGLYAQLGRGEWVMYNEPIDAGEYRKLMHTFTAEKFNPRAWAQTAKAAGMKYMVLTTRHHDGFSLWDSKASWGQFTSMQSAAHRDFVREYVDACREAGLKVGLYYSPLDWRFPGYFFPRMYAENAAELRTQCFEQIRELLTQYGKIDIFWFDGGEDYWLCHGRNLHKEPDGTDFRLNAQCPGFWHAEELDCMIRELQPGIVINNRYGNREFGDYDTPESRTGEFNIHEPWESNMTLNGSWGWVPTPPRSLREVLALLLENATGDGNFLLNVGPRADGEIEPAQVERLQEVGQWLTQFGESVYGTRGGPFRNSKWGGMTYRDRTLYVHVWDWKLNTVTLPRLQATILRVTSLTARELHADMQDGIVTFSVGAVDRLAPDTILEIELDRPVRELVDDTVSWCGAYTEQICHEALIVERM